MESKRADGAAGPWGCGDLKFGGYLRIATVMSVHITGYCCQLQATGSSPLKASAQAFSLKLYLLIVCRTH